MRQAGVLVLMLALAGCGEGDGGGDDGPDAGVGDLAGADLTGAEGGTDGACAFTVFNGFAGPPANERRFDCPCGCLIDSFEALAGAGWNIVTENATFTPMTGQGLAVTVETTGSEVGIGALNSLNPGSTFVLDGDFELLVDWRLVGPMPRDAHVIFSLHDADPSPTGDYRLEREHTAAGLHQVTAMLGGVFPRSESTTATSGTFSLSRAGHLVQARNDSQLVSQFTGAVGSRLAIVLSAAVDGCESDAGTCTFTVVWRNLRLAKGALADRR